MLALLIVGGAISAEPAVVPLLRDGALVCSGSIVAPHAVLTAAHCLADMRPLTIEGRAVIARITIPTFEPNTLAHDLAIAIVDAPFTSAPLGMGIVTGDAIRIVGFGQTMLGDTTGYEQRAGMAAIDAIEPAHLHSRGPALTCAGDSGGPALAAGAIVGVTSSGDCTSYSRHARTDVDAAFVTDTVAATAVGTAGPGGRCWYDANCANGAACVAAVDEPSRSFCAPACTDVCAGELVCVDGLCRHPRPSPGAEGSTCKRDGDCASQACLAPQGEGDAICVRRCFSDLPGFTCPTDTTCLSAAGGGEACFQPHRGGCSTAPDPGLALAIVVVVYGWRRQRRCVAPSTSAANA